MFIDRFFLPRILCPLGACLRSSPNTGFQKPQAPRAVRRVPPCTKRCSMVLQLNKTNVVTSAECIDSMNCVKGLPAKNVTANPKPPLGGGGGGRRDEQHVLCSATSRAATRPDSAVVSAARRPAGESAVSGP
jgi:hypothetical protein